MTEDHRPDGTRDDPLRALASSFGVSTEYHDWQGRHVVVPDATIVAVLAALGVDASSPQASAEVMAQQRLARWRRAVPACTVVRAGALAEIAVCAPADQDVGLTLRLEDGSTVELGSGNRTGETEEVEGRALASTTFSLPHDLPLGWHEVLAGSGGTTLGHGALVVTPDRLELPAGVRDAPAWGFMVQLYATRSSRSWGLGDLGDLRELAAWSAKEHAAGFVLVNPLHAAEPVPPVEPSPYLPVTRRFVNPLYIRVEDVPECAGLEEKDRAVVEQLAARQKAHNRLDEELDRDAVLSAKQEALTLVHRLSRSSERQQSFDAFRDREGEGLVDFATWCMLAELHGRPFGEWPEDLRDPRSPGVAAVREANAERVDYYCWLQWVLDEQLAAAQEAATSAGMPLGVVHDLAVGVHPGGADAWGLGSALARAVTVGAPPDAFNQQGQDWSQPPWRPDALAEAAYAPYVAMVRTVLRHSGGIRIDHIIGLFRLWWVPEGQPPSEGTYVRYDHEALIGILALEASRAGAVVIGEDLGNVEPWVRTYLRERGVLGTSILWFEKDYAADRPLRPDEWRELCLATVTTHDLPPTAGYLRGEHIRIRSELGLLTRSEEEERRVDAAERRQWIDLLRTLHLLPGQPGEPEPDLDTVREALHRYLSRTPSRLLGVALPDAVGDLRAINQPGTHREYPNWSLPVADGAGRPVLLDELMNDEQVAALARAVRGG